MQHPALQAIVQQSLPLSTEMALPVAPSIKGNGGGGTTWYGLPSTLWHVTQR